MRLTAIHSLLYLTPFCFLPFLNFELVRLLIRSLLHYDSISSLLPLLPHTHDDDVDDVILFGNVSDLSSLESRVESYPCDLLFFEMVAASCRLLVCAWNQAKEKLNRHL